MVFQGEDWFGTLSDLQSSNKIASVSIGATVGMGSTVSVPGGGGGGKKKKNLHQRFVIVG